MWGAVAVAALGFGFGWAGNQERSFERAAANEIAGRLEGEAKRVSVNVRPYGLGGAWGELELAEIRASQFSVRGLPLHTEPERSTKGKVKSLVIDLADFRLRGLRVERLRAEIPGCRYDLGLALGKRTFRLSRSGEGTGWVSLLDADLADYILRKYAEITEVTVRSGPGFVSIDGRGDFLVVKASFSVLGRLEPEGGRRLVLTDPMVFLDGKRTTGAVADALLQTLNPVVDFDEDLGLEGAVDVESVRHVKGGIEATARVRVPIRPHRADGTTPALRATIQPPRPTLGTSP
jgi:hypothetical protein